MVKQPRIKIGVLITKDDQVLLVKGKNAHGDGTWSTPTGHLEYGKLLEACAMRTSQEEIGMIITDVTFLAITNDVFEAQKDHHAITIWMAGRYVSGTTTIPARHTAAAMDWFSWDALPEPLFLPFEHLLTGQCYPALWDFSGGGGEKIHKI
ncbi:MAG: NUDIX domain-containing protein [Ktedonobacteraceae bacterium]